MPEEKKYAIRCTTEEQARECDSKRIPFCVDNKVVRDKGHIFIDSPLYTIITYSEALSLGLLGEKKEECKHSFSANKCVFCGKLYRKSDYNEPQKVEPVIITKEDEIALGWRESPSEDNLVEKIMEDIESDCGSNRTGADMGYIEYSTIREILKKNLSSK